jgi:ribosome modulation factor
MAVLADKKDDPIESATVRGYWAGLWDKNTLIPI